MSHRDRDGHTPDGRNTQDLKAVFQWLLKTVDFSSISFRRGSGWLPRGLCIAVLLWVWSDQTALLRRFKTALKIARRLEPQGVPQQLSYQAFMKLLVRWTGPLLIVLTAALRGRMETALRSEFRIAGYAIFGGDGSRLELPRTASNESRFSPAKSRCRPKRKSRRGGGRRTRAARKQRARQKKADTPQLWLTTMWHAGTGLPWDWRIGPSDSSERGHLLEMIDGLPADALVAADAGFVGYEFWSKMLSSRREFVIRVGANVRLLKKLGDFRENGNTVYLWPQHAVEKNHPPLVLRLVVVQGARHPWYLVTSVLDQKRLSDQEVAEIYALRWGVELYYRHFKQTFERRKLRSHTADHAECEAHWSLLGLWAMLLHAEQYLHRRHVPLARISVANVLHAYRTAMREYKSHPDPGESLWEVLPVALIDDYQRRTKASRGFPRKKYDPPTGTPQIGTATKQQIAAAKQLLKENKPKRLTA